MGVFIPKSKLKVAVLVEHRGKLLLIRERLDPKDPYRWNIIKGTFEPDVDKDLIVGAKRECREEANARVTITKLLNVLYVFKHGIAFMQFNFVGKLIGTRFGIAPRAVQKKFSEDIVEARLFSRKELLTMKKKEFIGERTNFVIQEWLRGAPRCDLDILKRITKL